jgi:iron complex transport system substrate-binding protein
MSTPSRIVSLAPSATSIVCALGAKKRLVGVTRWCKDVAPVAGLPTFGDCWRCDTTGVARLKPDLVIGSVPYNPEVVSGLLGHGLTVLAMNPRTLADIFSDILMLGRLLGRERQAKRVVQRMQARFDRVVAARGRIGRRPRVYVEVWANPFIVAPPWVEEMVTLAGGRFVPRGGGRKVTQQEVLAARPEIVILAWAARGLNVDTRKVLRRAGWGQVPAFRRGQVYLVSDETVNTPSPVAADGLERLARIIHPEIFGAPDADPKVVHAGTTEER